MVEPESAEEALEMARRLAISGAVDLLVVDSAAALVPSLELETGIGESGSGLHGRVLASGLRKTGDGRDQERRRGPVSQPDARPPGAIRRRGGDHRRRPVLEALRRGAHRAGPAGGRRVRFRVLKNKVAAAFAEGDLSGKGAGIRRKPVKRAFRQAGVEKTAKNRAFLRAFLFTSPCPSLMIDIDSRRAFRNDAA